MRVLLCLVLMGWVAMSSAPEDALAQAAPAQDKAKVNVAKQYVDAGLAAQNSGDYAMAITLYSKAYQLVPHPVLLFNLAQAHRLAGHFDRALTLYQEYIDADPHGAQVPTARDLVAEIQARKAAPAQPAAAPRNADTIGKAKAVRNFEAVRDSEATRKEKQTRGDDAAAETDENTDENTPAQDGETTGREPEPGDNRAPSETSVSDARNPRRIASSDGDGTAPVDQRSSSTPTGPKSASPPARSSRPWKTSLIVSAVLTSGSAGYTAFEWTQASRKAAPGESESSCEQSPETTACGYYRNYRIGLVITGVGVAGMLVSSILLVYTTRTGSSAVGAQSGKPRAAIVPVVTPDSAGAALSLAW